MRNQYEIDDDIVGIRLDRKDGNHLWTLVNLEDFERINKEIPGKIYAMYYDTIDNFYAAYSCKTKDNKRTMKLLHSFLMDFPKAPYIVSHLNKVDTLDNRRRNLRVMTVAQRNQSARIRSDNKTGIPGVSWNTKTKKWCVFLTDTDGKYKSFGSYKDFEEAKNRAINKSIEIKGDLSPYYNREE